MRIHLERNPRFPHIHIHVVALIRPIYTVGGSIGKVTRVGLESVIKRKLGGGVTLMLELVSSALESAR